MASLGIAQFGSTHGGAASSARTGTAQFGVWQGGTDVFIGLGMAQFSVVQANRGALADAVWGSAQFEVLHGDEIISAFPVGAAQLDVVHATCGTFTWAACATELVEACAKPASPTVLAASKAAAVMSIFIVSFLSYAPTSQNGCLSGHPKPL